MLGNLTYVAPFIITNGMTTYALSKMSEKKLIARFQNIKTLKAKDVKEKPTVPNEIKELVTIIEESVDKSYLNNLYNNLISVKIKKNLPLVLLGIKGKYDNQYNTLDYSIKGSIEHELIHLSSACYDAESGMCQSGFVYYDKNFTLCKALNEGYTDLTARRLFDKKTTFYNGEVRLAQFFELLFDKNELQKYYFTNDLRSFINRLSTFVEREEAIKMLIKFELGFNLKKWGNPAYKIIYTNLELKLSKIFANTKKPIDKQFDHINLLGDSPITKTIQKIKKPYVTM
ncbi:MAG: hypothetical protein PHT75_03815 [Bacilli bacterium]|nr:hypothetical protein [Bacilli bacterium]MDD3305218.1 hypothetical protein [Bacilli bacterium]MDD4054083.1 hypothetical protein [Bacilli bacterium]MDD4411876.1 hypothetical protein [Bacilli bacterium]